jgi:hypothetical protein
METLQVFLKTEEVEEEEKEYVWWNTAHNIFQKKYLAKSLL